MTEKNTQAAPQIESVSEARSAGEHLAGIWLKRIERAKGEESKWFKDAQESIRVFEADDNENVNFNVWHSNLETVRPTLFNSTPIPDVRRRFDDGDQIAKDVVDLTERCISYCSDTYDIDTAFKAIIKDAVVTGRGVGRVRYKPLFNADGMVVYEQVMFERVKWDRFIRGPGISWEDVRWIAFEHRLSRDELKKLNKKVGAEIGVGDPDDERARSRDKQKDEHDKGIFYTAKTYEIWDRDTGKVAWVAEDEPTRWLKKPEDDPLGLDGFFPVLKPLQPSMRLSGLTPLVPYQVIKPLLQELDKVSKRINKIISVMRARGIVAADLEGDMELLKDCDDGEMVYAKSSLQFAQGAGGLDNAIHYWPIERIIPVLQGLREHRIQLLQEIDQVSGISDILRGQTDARETLGAQQIKAQYGGVRIQDWQNDVAALARDLFRAKAEIFAGKFSDQSLVMMSGMPDSQDQEAQARFPAVLEMFRSDLRGFKIDIETDSTVRSDLTRSQEQFANFLSGTSQFVSALPGMIQMVPQSLPAFVEVYTSFARKFKLGKQAEDSLDKLSMLVEQAAQQAQNQPEQPDPAVMEAQAKIQQMAEQFQLTMQQKQAEGQQKLQQSEAEHAQKLDHQSQEFELQQQIEARKLEGQLMIEDQRHSFEMENKRALADQDLQVKQLGAEQKFQEQDAKQRLNAANDQGGDIEDITKELERVAKLASAPRIIKLKSADGEIIEGTARVEAAN